MGEAAEFQLDAEMWARCERGMSEEQIRDMNPGDLLVEYMLSEEDDDS